MAMTHFHDGRILITTITDSPTPAEVAAACEAVRANGRTANSPVLLDARECEAPELRDWISQVLDSGAGTPRFAVLLKEGQPAQAGAFQLIAAQHGSEARSFENVGLALHWLWRLDDAMAAPVGPRPQNKLPRDAQSPRLPPYDPGSTGLTTTSRA